MTEAKKKKAPSKKEVSTQVKIYIETAGVITSSFGETVLEALEGLDMDWKRVRYKNIVTINKGKAKTERIYNIVKMKKVLNNKQFRQTEAKYIELVLK